MTSVPKCPYCLKKFKTVEEVTQHLINGECSVQSAARAEAEKQQTNRRNRADSPPKPSKIVPES